jgi:hypothetical protein
MIPLKFFFKGTSRQLGSDKNIQQRCMFVKGRNRLFDKAAFAPYNTIHPCLGIERKNNSWERRQTCTREAMK